MNTPEPNNAEDDDPPPTRPPAKSPSSPRWQSEHLLQGCKEVLIHHGDEIYRLRLTRQGKLILNK